MGWKCKFIFLLVVYFAGFATAIYTLVPASAQADDNYGKTTAQSGLAASIFKSDNFAISCRAKMDKCLKLAGRGFRKVGKMGREKLVARTEKNDK